MGAWEVRLSSIAHQRGAVFLESSWINFRVSCDLVANLITSEDCRRVKCLLVFSQKVWRLEQTLSFAEKSIATVRYRTKRLQKRATTIAIITLKLAAGVCQCDAQSTSSTDQWYAHEAGVSPWIYTSNQSIFDTPWRHSHYAWHSDRTIVSWTS